jgi:pheromone shutdown protein TraB
MRSKKRGDRTTVTLLGLVHATGMRPDLRRAYLRNLHETIVRLHPDCICVELSPEQLAGTVTSKSKPEYRSTILPAAELCHARLEPIEPPVARGMKMEIEKTRLFALARRSKLTTSYLEFSDSLGGLLARRIHRIAAQPDGIARLQNPDIHELLETLWHLHKQHLPTGISRLWHRWNDFMAARVMEASAANRGGSLLVTVGLQHVFSLQSLLCRDGKNVLTETSKTVHS